MQGKICMLGPIALTNTLTTNIFNPPTATGGTNGGSSAQYAVFNHFRITNKTTAAATFSLYRGATGANTAGTEFLGTAMSIPANSAMDFYGAWRFDSTDFLVGGAGTATALTLEGEYQMGVAG